MNPNEPFGQTGPAEPTKPVVSVNPADQATGFTPSSAPGQQYTSPTPASYPPGQTYEPQVFTPTEASAGPPNPVAPIQPVQPTQQFAPPSNNFSQPESPAQPPQPQFQAPNPAQNQAPQITPPDPSQFFTADTAALNYAPTGGAPYGGAVPKRRRRVLPILVVLAVLLLAGGSVGAWQYQQYLHSPAKVFDAAFKNSLSVRSFSGSLTSNTVKFKLMADTSDIKNVRTTVDLTLDLGGGPIAMSEYSGGGDLYQRYNSLGDYTDQARAQGVLNAWTQVEKDGKSLVGDESVPQLTFGGYENSVLGQLIIGNFSKSQQTELANFIRDSHIYKTDLAKAKTVQVGGHTAYSYNITLNTDALKLLNEKVIKMMGKQPSDSDPAYDSVKTATIYVDKQTARIVKVETTEAGEKETITYSGFNTSNPGKVPTATIDAKTVMTKVNSILLNSPPTPSAHDTTDTQDLERQNDIDSTDSYLEAFYAEKSYYPALAQLNDLSWVVANLKGLDKESLKDPAGSGYALVASPAPRIYSYQTTDCAGGQCAAFVLSANLSDGTAYTKSSL